MDAIDVDGLLRKGVGNITINELTCLVEALVRKRSRAHIRDHVSHKLLDTVSLEERCNLIVGGLSDEFYDKGDGYKFGFDSVGLYLPRKNGDLGLVASHGDIIRIIKSDNPLASYKGHIQPAHNGGEYSEVIIPLVANGQYQGTIIIGNTKSGTPINFSELFNFLHSYADMAAGAIYGAHEHERVTHESYRATRLLDNLRAMTARIVHDLKNPLAIIGGFARRISMKTEGQANANAKIIADEVSGMEKKVKDLLDFAISESDYEAEVGVYRLNEEISSTFKRLEKKAEEKGMKFLYTPNPATAEINADPRLMYSILENLVVNAIIHGNAKSEISISAEKKEDGLYLYVTNKGCLAEPEKVHEPFYTTKNGKEGTGLGVPIIENNLKLMKGSFSIKNQKVGDAQEVHCVAYLPQQKLNL